MLTFPTKPCDSGVIELYVVSMEQLPVTPVLGRRFQSEPATTHSSKDEALVVKFVQVSAASDSTQCCDSVAVCVHSWVRPGSQPLGGARRRDTDCAPEDTVKNTHVDTNRSHIPYEWRERWSVSEVSLSEVDVTHPHRRTRTHAHPSTTRLSVRLERPKAERCGAARRRGVDYT